MKYPSLRNTALTIFDGRGEAGVPPEFLAAALMSLYEPRDSHILVLCSSKDQEDQYEQMGEERGHDFFFHAEMITRSGEFLDRCASAKTIVLPLPIQTHLEEIEKILLFRGTLVVSTAVAKEVSLSESQKVKILEANPSVRAIRNLVFGHSAYN